MCALLKPSGSAPLPEELAGIILCGQTAMPLANALNGRHTQVYDATGTYCGEFVDGQRQGHGVFEMDGFGRYEGGFHGNNMQGQGVLELPSGRRYEGEWRGSQQHGRGKYFWADGSVHEGEYVSGFKHGPGNFTWPDGSRYEGEFRDDLRTGKGIFWSFCGAMYEGEFLDGQFHGKGYYRSAAQDWSLEGNFVHQRPQKGVLSQIPMPGLKWGELTSGLKWEDGGPSLAKTGIELRLEHLTDALSRQQTFSQEEWDSLSVPNLTKESYVKVGNRYLHPTEPDRRVPAGDEVQNDALRLALATKNEFSEEEVESFRFSALTYNTYIKVGDVYFKPAKAVAKISNVQYDAKSKPIDTRPPKPKSSFEILDKASVPNRRPLPGEDLTPPKKLKAWEL